MTSSFPRIVKQDPVTDNLGFSLGEVTPATKGNQGPAITRFGWDKQRKGNSDEKCDEAFD